MARIIALKWAAKCCDCGAALAPGDRARYYGRGKVVGTECHADNRTFDDDGTRAERRRDDHEYAMGRMEAERYMSDKKIYGAALADEWEMEAEMARYNRGEC